MSAAPPSFVYWRAPALGGVEFAEGRGPVSSAEAPHFHAEGQYVLLLGGERLVERDSQRFRLGAGEALWVAPNAVHSTRALDGALGAAAHFLHGYLPPRLLERLAPRPPAAGVRRLVRGGGDAALLIERLRSAGEESLALQALTALFDLVPAPPPAPAAPSPSAVADAVEHARRWLDAHFAEPVALEHLAAAVGLSRFHLIRAFARRYGLTPHAWLLRRRVNHAKALLRRGQAPAEAALAAGFADQSHLGLHFRRLVGVTPAAYRRA